MTQTPRYCPNCGAPLTAEMRYCGSCGRAVTAQAAGTPRRYGWLIPAGFLGLLSCAVIACVAGIFVWNFSTGRSGRSRLDITPFPALTQLAGADAAATQTAPAPVAPTAVVPTAVAPTPVGPTPVGPTAAPSPVPSGAALLPVDDLGVRFSYSTSLASAVTAEVIQAQSEPDVPPWDVGPQYIKFHFKDYPLKDTFHQPFILVYPLDEYEKANPQVSKEVNQLKTLLQSHNDLPENGTLPFLPTWNAAQMFHAQVKQIQGAGSSGIRYITQYAQSFAPITSSALFYTYQGLSADGKHYIVAVLPVSHPSLQTGFEIPGGDYDKFSATYDQYLADIRTRLNEMQANTFTPDLETLDTMIESIVVK